jgi:DNA adenine methylase
MIKSPLRYPGGKSRAVKKISALVPDFKEYREPFVGGGSIFVYLKQMYPEKKFWINDLYENLFHFWNNCKNNPKELIKQILLWKNDFDIGKELYKYLLTNIDNFDESKKAAAFFVFNRITFSGTTESGGFSNAAFTGRFTDSSIERVKQLSTILDNTKITNYDFEEVIEESGEEVFIFLDPPYYSATKSALYGKNGNFHKNFDHIRFAEVMRNCKHKWLLTYDDSDYIKELYSFANVFKWDIKYGMRNVSNNSDQNGKEFFISNYLEHYPKNEQLKIFDINNYPKPYTTSAPFRG